MTTSYPISKPLADLISVYTSKPNTTRTPNFEYPRYYPEDEAVIATDGHKLLIYTLELPFPNTLLEVVRRTNGFHLIPLTTPDSPDRPLPYKKILPDNYPAAPTGEITISRNKADNYVPITDLIATHRLFVNYSFLEQTHKYPGTYDIYIPGPSSQNPSLESGGKPIDDSRERLLKLVCRNHPLTLLLMPFKNDYKNSH